MRFLVTGATGLVGSHVVDSLLARGHSVRTLVRQSSAADEHRSRGIDASVGDLSDEVTLCNAVEGVDVVVHSAARVNVGGSRDEMWDVNVGGTKRLLSACVEASVPRFAHVSSVAIYGKSAPPVKEDARKNPAGAYGASKWEAEQLVERFRQASNLRTVVLRPCVIYGERDRHAHNALSRIARLPVIPLARGGACLFDLVHASDVASAIIDAVTSEGALGNAYNLTDGESHTHRDILMTLERVVGRRPRILTVPELAFDAIDKLQGLMRHVSAKSAKRLGRLRNLDIDLHYSIDAARRDFGYQPKVSLEEGLKNAFDWASDERQPTTANQ